MKRVICSEKMSQDDMRETLENWVAVPDEAISLVESINGKSEQTYQDILYVYTGYHDFNTYKEEITEEIE